jgi:hypothetical protein
MESTKFTHGIEESVLPSTALNAAEQLVEMIEARLPFKLSFRSMMLPCPL